MIAPLVQLGDGFSAYTYCEMEARFIYKEIFIDHCYDIAPLPEKPFIIDAGANVGLFSIYIKKTHPDARVVAFEPASESLAMLKLNLKLHDVPGVELHPYALGSRESVMELTYYPEAPGNSTLFPEEKEMAARALREQKKLRPTWSDGKYENKVLESVPVKRLSDVLAQSTFERVDLIKLDVENAELDVLQGISDEHWPKIQNIVIEVSSLSGLLEDVESLLRSVGFDVKTRVSCAVTTNFCLYEVQARRPPTCANGGGNGV
jgi:FkbM family methyltransferase